MAMKWPPVFCAVGCAVLFFRPNIQSIIPVAKLVKFYE